MTTRILFSLCSLLAAGSLAQAQDPVKDLYKDTGSMLWRANEGQERFTNGQPNDQAAFVSEGTRPVVALCRESTLHFGWCAKDTIVSTPDTTFNISMQFIGENAGDIGPEPYMVAPGIANYYRGDVVAENVLAYHRALYAGVYPNTDVHVYHGTTGMRMAIVMYPGSTPDDLIMKFDGQDSLKVDMNGLLRIYIRGRWVSLNEAVAYQLDANNAEVPVNWLPSYVNSNGSDLVTFHFESYNPALPLVLRIGAPPAPPAPPLAEPRNMNWSSYVGGNEADELFAVDTDRDGDAYACGYTYGFNFPVGTGFQVFTPFDGMMQGSRDAVVMRFRSLDKRIVWATYLGGGCTSVFPDIEDGIDEANDLVVYKGANTALNYVFVTGTTGCPDFFVWTEADSPFAVADETPYNAPLTRLAAFMTAYRQDNGRLDWSTTMGDNVGAGWSTIGRGVDIDDDGMLIWGGRLSPTPMGSNIAYPYVTPGGAYTQANGGGFFVKFAPNYQIEWNTPWGSMSGNGGVFDVKLVSYGVHGERAAVLTGSTAGTYDVSIWPLYVTNATGNTGYYQGSPLGGNTDAYFTVLDMNSHSVYYSTYWGGPGEDHGLALAERYNGSHELFMAGCTNSTSFSSAALPDAGGLHDTQPGGGNDGYLLKWNIIGNNLLRSGTLYGGAGDDAIFDLDMNAGCVNLASPCQLYLSGETSSNTDMLFTEDYNLYRQNELGNGGGNPNGRDGFVLGLNASTLLPVWSSYFGGTLNDKAWGIAASPTEVYLCGGTLSEQSFFPLREFNTATPEDWYDGDIYNNQEGQVGHAQWANWLDFDAPFTGGGNVYQGHSHDGFIASFGVTQTVGVGDVQPNSTLAIQLIDGAGIWAVRCSADQQLCVTDALGRMVVAQTQFTNTNAIVDLRRQAAGLYVVRVIGTTGTSVAVKVLKP
jgi:hypothetical protein